MLKSVVEQTYPFVDVHLQSGVVEREEVAAVDAGRVALSVLQHNKQRLKSTFCVKLLFEKKKLCSNLSSVSNQ